MSEDFDTARILKLFPGLRTGSWGITSAADEGYNCIAWAAGGEVLHAARQLPDGRWTSKVGQLQDIVHDRPSDLEGEKYGKVCCYLRRSVKRDSAGKGSGSRARMTR